MALRLGVAIGCDGFRAALLWATRRMSSLTFIPTDAAEHMSDGTKKIANATNKSVCPEDFKLTNVNMSPPISA